MKRVGIFSGTFDPIHNGHIAFAKEALEVGNLDKIFFLVEPRPRRKQGVRAFEHRVRMVQLAIADEPKFGSIILEQSRFTAQHTLPVLQNRFKGAQLWMLLGDDMLDHLADWPHVETLINSVHFLIGCRHKTEQDVKQLVKNIYKTRNLLLHAMIFKAEQATTSSSKVKRQLRSGKMPATIHSGVQQYIQANKLYWPAENS